MKIRTMTDQQTGERYRWNETVVYCGLVVPCMITRNSSRHVHPARVPWKLLAELNPGVNLKQHFCMHVCVTRGVCDNCDKKMETEGAIVTGVKRSCIF